MGERAEGGKEVGGREVETKMEALSRTSRKFANVIHVTFFWSVVLCIVFIAVLV